MYVYDKAQAEYIFSEAFEHMLKTGLAIVGIYMDYQNDKVNGDIKFYWKPFNALMLDPYFTRRDLSDCDQASTRDLLSREQVKALLPWVPEDIINSIPTGIRDNKYQYLGIYRQYNSTYIAKNLLTYDQYWRRINKPQKFLVDLETGVSQEWTGDEEEERVLREEIGQGKRVELINSHKRSVELNIIVGGKLVYEGPDPTGLDTFPFIPLIAYHEPLIDTYELKIQGVVRSIRDAQRQYNRRHSQIIDLMESIINTGFIHKNGAVLDPDMLFQSGQGRNIVVNPEFDVQADIKQISPPNIPSGYLQYQDIMDNNIMEIPGASEELLGLSSTGDVQVSGKLAEVRASNGLKGNRGLFDNFEFAQKLFGDLNVMAVQRNYTPGKVWRITGQEPTPQFFSQQFEQYDCVIKSAVKTQTQREAYYYQLLQLRALGIYVSDEQLIEAAPLQGKTKLVEEAQKNSEMKRKVQELEIEDRKIKNMQLMSLADQNVALAQERRARVLSDIGLARERISEGEQNYAKALLDNAKTVSEMKANHNNSVMDAVRLAMEMSQLSKERANETLEQDSEVMEALKTESSAATQPLTGQPVGQGDGQINGGTSG